MSLLVKSQLNIFCVMVMGGMAAGLVMAVFREFAEIRNCGSAARAILEMAGCISAGFIVSEFLFFCDNGKITFEGIGSFIAGLLLWKKYFCGILKPIGGSYGEKKDRRKCS